MIYKGKDITKMTADELRSFRKEVQIIFQDPYSSLNPRMTIGDAIIEPMQVHNILDSEHERKKRQRSFYQELTYCQVTFIDIHMSFLEGKDKELVLPEH